MLCMSGADSALSGSCSAWRARVLTCQDRVGPPHVPPHLHGRLQEEPGQCHERPLPQRRRVRHQEPVARGPQGLSAARILNAFSPRHVALTTRMQWASYLTAVCLHRPCSCHYKGHTCHFQFQVKNAQPLAALTCCALMLSMRQYGASSLLVRAHVVHERPQGMWQPRSSEASSNGAGARARGRCRRRPRRARLACSARCGRRPGGAR